MIKGLFFAAALLAPGLAYGGGPTATLSDQVVDPPGPPTPPTQASVAGFTTCIICMDFTAASGGVFVNGSAPAGVNAAQTNTWLDCGGASNPVWYQGSIVGTAGPCPVIATDDQSTQVLQTQLGGPVTLTPGAKIFNGLKIGDPFGEYLGLAGTPVPTNLYLEATYRVPIFPQQTDQVIQPYSQGPWKWLGSGAPKSTTGPSDWLEFDAFEVCCGGLSGSNFWNGAGSWYSNGSWGAHAGFSSGWYLTYPPVDWSSHDMIGSYIKVGMRITSDGSSGLYFCYWVNDQPQGCRSKAVDNSSLYGWQLSDTSRGGAVFYSASGGNNISTTTTEAMPNMKDWLKSINIWACSAWKTTACSTPGNPDPGGY